MKTNLKRDVKKKEIILEARKLFLAQGVPSTSISQIAINLGIAKSLFYYYFQTKEDVLDAVELQICEEYIADLDERFTASKNDFFHHLAIIFSVYCNLFPRHRLINDDDILFEEGQISRFHQRFILQSETLIHKVIEEGRTLGYLQEDNAYPLLLMSFTGINTLVNMDLLDHRKSLELLAQSLDLPIKKLTIYTKILDQKEKEEKHGKRKSPNKKGRATVQSTSETG